MNSNGQKIREFMVKHDFKDFEDYFKIGVSDDYILMRRDFPIGDMPPGDFGQLIEEMFRKNKEALTDGK